MNLKIDHRLGVIDVEFFSDFTLNLKYDSIASTFNINFYFDPKNQQHAEMACVTHFHEAIVQHQPEGGQKETLITGYILSQKFISNSQKQLVTISGYSKPGVLEDCDIPTEVDGQPQADYMQYDGLTLKEITQKIIAPFKLKLKIDGVAVAGANNPLTLEDKLDTTIDKVTGLESKNIKSFLTELAIQRNIVLSHNEKGDLVFTEAKTNQVPLFHVEKGVIATEIILTYNGQPIHSQITAVRNPDSTGGNTDSNEFTIFNPLCPIVFRPKVIVQSSGDPNTLEEFAKNALAAELKNIPLLVKLDRWDVNGKVVRPNNTITCYSPENFIYKKTLFFIESVEYKGNSKEQICILTCVLPEAYNRQTPKNIFVDPHKNFPRI